MTSDPLGYEDAKISPVFERRMFCKGPFQEGTHHLHVVDYGSPVWAEPVLLRDYLRAHPADAAWYLRVKRESAAEHQNELNGYHEGKSGCITVLMERARAWRPAKG